MMQPHGAEVMAEATLDETAVGGIDGPRWRTQGGAQAAGAAAAAGTVAGGSRRRCGRAIRGSVLPCLHAAVLCTRRGGGAISMALSRRTITPVLGPRVVS